MSIEYNNYKELLEEIKHFNALLVAVSKTKPISDIQALFELGQMDFGENYVNELVEKQSQLSDSIHWHFIGHLQSNKVKYIAPFVYLIHGVDSKKLLKEISKQAINNNRKIDVLLQIHIAEEATKFGLSPEECQDICNDYSNGHFPGCVIRGLMGMATFTDDIVQVRNEFKSLHQIYNSVKNINREEFNILSMGMSGDYKIALEEGSTMVRIGSLIFGSRN